MARTSSIMTRVEPEIKEQAEAVLSQLGISMSAAMAMYLRQIALQRKIPFEMKLPPTSPIALENITDDDFNALMNEAVKSYEQGRCTNAKDFKAEFHKDIGV